MRVANTKTKIAVGAFIMVILGAALVAVMMIGEGLDNFKQHRRFAVSFPDASGLQDGAPVKIGGLTVGNVHNLRLEYVSGVAAAVADLEVLDPHYKLVRGGMQALLETQGVLGDKYVSLAGGSPDAAEIADGAWLPTVKQMTLQDVTVRANSVLQDFEGTMTAVRTFTEKVMQPGSVVDVAASPEAGKRLLTALKNFETSSTALDVVVARAGNVVAKIDEGQGTIGLLVNDPGLYDDAKSIMGRSNRNRVARGLVQQALRQGEEKHKPAITH